MAIIEASALGVPCVGGIRSGAVPWLLDEGRAGLLVDITSGKRLAEGMCRLAADPELRGAMAARARGLAEQRFHIGRVADAYRGVYEAVVRAR